MLRSFIKFICYSNPICRLLRHKFIATATPAFAATYCICFEVFREELFFVQYPNVSKGLFFGLIGLSFIITIVRGLADWIEESQKKNMEGLSIDLIQIASKMVKLKLNRFKDFSSSLPPKGNIFRKITQPDQQINALLHETLNSLQKRFKLAENEISITIIHIDQSTSDQKIYYKYKTHVSWSQTRPKTLFEKNSAAKQCIDTGEPVFYPNKKKAEHDGMYYSSKRDQRHNNGSIYCYPSLVRTPSYQDTYIISIVTYNKTLCNHKDIEGSEALKVIFNEICRRIDLELTLNLIKNWQCSQ